MTCIPADSMYLGKSTNPGCRAREEDKEMHTVLTKKQLQIATCWYWQYTGLTCWCTYVHAYRIQCNVVLSGVHIVIDIVVKQHCLLSVCKRRCMKAVNMKCTPLFLKRRYWWLNGLCGYIGAGMQAYFGLEFERNALALHRLELWIHVSYKAYPQSPW